MTLTEIMPVLVFLAMAAFVGWVAFAPPVTKPGLWRYPAALSAVFTLWTFWCLTDGLLPVWQNHSQNLWGNQVWFDLLFAVAMIWVLLLPRARALGMNIPFWFLMLFTASIGLLAMFARMLYLEERTGVSEPAQS